MRFILIYCFACCDINKPDDDDDDVNNNIFYKQIKSTVSYMK